MRRRVLRRLKGKEIYLSEFNEKACNIGENVYLCDKFELSRSAANYKVRTESMLSNNKALNCSLDLEKSIQPRKFNYIPEMNVSPSNLEFYLNSYYRKVNFLDLDLLKTEDIAAVLARISSILSLNLNSVIFNANLSFSNPYIHEISLYYCKINRKIVLPKTNSLHLEGCLDVFNLICPKVSELTLYCPIGEEDNLCKWLNSLKSLKKLSIKYSNTHNLIRFIPLNLRSLSDNAIFRLKIERERFYKFWSKQHFYLNYLDLGCLAISLSKIENLALKYLNCFKLIDDVEGKVKTRFRKIKVTGANVLAVNNHPEMISKCRFIEVNTILLDLKVVPSYLSLFKIGEKTSENCFFNQLKQNALKLTDTTVDLSSIKSLSTVERILSCFLPKTRVVVCYSHLSKLKNYNFLNLAY